MVPVEPMQVAVVKSVSSTNSAKDGKSGKSFAKTLTSESDKNAMDVDSKVKSDDNSQLLALMAGMVPPVVVGVVPVKQATGDVSNGDTTNATATPLVKVDPNTAQAKLVTAFPDGSQVQSSKVVLDDAMQTQLTKAVAGTPQTKVISDAPQTKVVSDVSQAQSPKVVSTMPQPQLPNVVTDVPQIQSANVPKTQVTGAAQPQLNASVDSSQSQLAALVGKMTSENVPVDNSKLAELTALQSQVQMQSNPTSIQVDGKDLAAQNATLVTGNPVLATNIVPSLIPVTANTSSNVNNSKQVDSKKIGIDPTSVGKVQIATGVGGVVNAVDVKPVLSAQATEAVVDALTSDKKNQAESVAPVQSAKDPDAFANLLNQQGLKMESQVTSDVKQVASQPVADPYDITTQIVDQARLVAGNKNTEMIIQLKPEHLGELTLKVTVENGVVSASFHSNSPEVRTVIESSLYQLKQELSSQGLKVDNVGVYAGLGQFFSNQQQTGNQQQPVVKVPNNSRTEEDLVESFDAITAAVDKTADATGVDYRA